MALAAKLEDIQVQVQQMPEKNGERREIELEFVNTNTYMFSAI